MNLAVTTRSIETTAFPEFEDRQLEAIAELAELVNFEAEEELISHGQKNYPFYIIKSGTVRIVISTVLNISSFYLCY